MRILAVSDIVDPVLYDRYDAAWWQSQHVDLIISCGDLPADYLSFLVSAFNVPLFYVPGNHDGGYHDAPPEGCDSIDGRLVTWNDLHLLGLGGSLRYNGGPEQYAEWEMELRALRLKPAIWRAGRLDLVVTHAPPRLTSDHPAPATLLSHGALPETAVEDSPRPSYPGDGPDHVHQGFHAFNNLIQAHHPRYLLHGHTHLLYGRARRTVEIDHTPVIDVYGHYLLDL